MLIILLLILIPIIGLIFYFTYFMPKFDPEHKAESFLKQKMYNEAISEYNKILVSEPDNSRIHYKLAEIFQVLKEYDKVIIHLEEVLRIDLFNYDFDKVDVLKKLAETYFIQEDIGEAFRLYIEIFSISPDDMDALFNVSFIALGQEEFDLAKKYFTRLLNFKRNDFEVFFGAGISNYQTNNISEALKFFQDAVKLKPISDIGNLAIAFALQRMGSHRNAVAHLNKFIDKVTNPDVLFLSKRLLAFSLLLSNRADEGKKVFLELLEIEKNSDLQDNELITLYDLGFACLKAKKIKQAHTYWHRLSEIDSNYNNVGGLLKLLKKDMKGSADEDDFEMSAVDYIEDWESSAFPDNFLWEICGLKSNKSLDIKKYLVKTKVKTGYSLDKKDIDNPGVEHQDRIEHFCNMDTENFRIIANRIVSKLGYKVDEILQSYRDSDGVDFIAYSSANNNKTLVWVRRWKEGHVGEITLRNFAQAINDSKAGIGLFITTVQLTDAAHITLKKLSKVTLIYPEEVNDLLRGLI